MILSLIVKTISMVDGVLCFDFDGDYWCVFRHSRGRSYSILDIIIRHRTIVILVHLQSVAHLWLVCLAIDVC